MGDLDMRDVGATGAPWGGFEVNYGSVDEDLVLWPTPA
jgi:hypothetical protein